ncbi:hypothetical protein NLJ89_g2191 [Agrocybe chaxingu]|uniref:Uncharacterized protein n=1 Tax=Agrocybe chaxingu TaxID=84603 RepID=A0A9W8K4V2_9AGAR|nr:hypothetical protein NLJ89_g2191 [Agrocybe chaxingu]
MSGRILSQSLRVSRRAVPFRSVLPQHLSARLASTVPSNPAASSPEPSSSTPPPAPESEPTYPLRRTGNGAERAERLNPRHNLRTAHIRTWKPVNNIADAYALIQAVERKYGKILEVHFLKDFEMVGQYQLFAWVVFMDPESLKRVPEEGFEFCVRASGVSKPTHEIGLEDVIPLTLTEEYDKNYEFPTLPEDSAEAKNYIGARINRDEKDYMDLSGSPHIYQNTSRRTMEAFLRWGGFAPLEPIDPKRRIALSEIVGQTDLDQVHMRSALQVSADYTGLPNPGVINIKAASSAPTTASAAPTSGLSGSAVFAGLLEKKGAPSKKDWVQSSPKEPFPSFVPAPSTPARSDPSEPPTVKTAPKPSAPPPPPTPAPVKTAAPKKPVPLTPEEMSAREALKEQLNAAKLLQMSTSPVRRKQPKPQIKQPKRSELASRADAEELPPAEEETGFLGKIWGLFRR